LGNDANEGDKNMRVAFVVVAGALLLSACGGGRMDPQSSFLDPICMPDGSVVFYEYPNTRGEFDTQTASKAHCPWNKRATASAAR
jgi:hypothetical protein